MLLTLTPHPDTPCDAVQRIEVIIERRTLDVFELQYVVFGDTSRVAFPAKQPSGRADELWRTTCFEAFFGDPGIGAGYVEVNASPTTQWATYSFGSYRSGMTPDDSVVTGLEQTMSETRYVMSLEVCVPNLDDPSVDDYDRLALSSVIEERDGRKSYWALAHAPGRPDFHSPAGFAIKLSDLEPA
jgi:hypothetical protein